MTRQSQGARRAVVEAVVAGVIVLTALLAAAWPDWLEAFGIDPDRGNGAVEFAIPLALTLAAVVVALLARRDWRIARAKALQLES